MSDDGDAGNSSGQVNVAVTWPAVAMPPTVVNQFAASLASTEANGGDLVLTIGWVGFPILSGPIEDQMEQAKAIQSLEATPVARLALNRTATAELLGILTQAVGKWDEVGSQEVADHGDH